MRIYGGAYNSAAVSGHIAHNATGRSVKNISTNSGKDGYFLAYEADNPGLFNENDDRYYMNASYGSNNNSYNGNNNSVASYAYGNNNDGSVANNNNNAGSVERVFRKYLKLYVTDQDGNKTYQTVEVHAIVETANILVVNKPYHGGPYHGGTRRRRSGRRSTRKRSTRRRY